MLNIFYCFPILLKVLKLVTVIQDTSTSKLTNTAGSKKLFVNSNLEFGSHFPRNQWHTWRFGFKFSPQELIQPSMLVKCWILTKEETKSGCSKTNNYMRHKENWTIILRCFFFFSSNGNAWSLVTGRWGNRWRFLWKLMWGSFWAFKGAVVLAGLGALLCFVAVV